MPPTPAAKRNRSGAIAIIALAGLLGALIVLVMVEFWKRSNHQDAPASNNTSGTLLGDLSVYSETPIYWVGDNYKGFPFDRAILPPPSGSHIPDPAFVLYGDCGGMFETGCEPTMLLKIVWGCLRAVDEPERIRTRTIHRAEHLSVQAGGVVVEIYADPSIQDDVADKMVIANQSAFPGADKPGSDLPGSLCEITRFNPQPTRTPPPPEPTSSNPAEQEGRATAAAVFDAFESFGPSEFAYSFEDAEQRLGWRVLRTTDPRYTFQGAGGFIGVVQKFKNPLWMFDQQTGYRAIGHQCPVQLSQEPESYLGRKPDNPIVAAVKGWTGELWQSGDDAGFVFFSGEMIEGQRIRVDVAGHCGYTIDEIRRFVETLHFGE